MNPTQNHFELSVRNSLFHLFDYYVDGKQGLGLPEMNLFEGFHSWETRRILAGVCDVEGKQDPAWAAAEVLWHVIVPGLHSSRFASRHKLNYRNLLNIMIMCPYS